MFWVLNEYFVHLILERTLLLKYIYFDYILVLESFFVERVGQHQVEIKCIRNDDKRSFLEPGLNSEA